MAEVRVLNLSGKRASIETGYISPWEVKRCSEPYYYSRANPRVFPRLEMFIEYVLGADKPDLQALLTRAELPREGDVVELRKRILYEAVIADEGVVESYGVDEQTVERSAEVDDPVKELDIDRPDEMRDIDPADLADEHGKQVDEKPLQLASVDFTSVEGIGPSTAEDIDEHLHDEAIESIDQLPEDLTVLPGVGPATGERLANYLYGLE